MPRVFCVVNYVSACIFVEKVAYVNYVCAQFHHSSFITAEWRFCVKTDICELRYAMHNFTTAACGFLCKTVISELCYAFTPLPILKM
jgi:hypothetical protein